MDMRMAYRIASQPTVPPVAFLEMFGKNNLDRNVKMLLGRADCEREMILKSPKFIFDNVADFYYENDKEEWDMQDDIPNMAPPFQCFFVEWNESRVIKMNGEVTENNCGAQIGSFVLAMDHGLKNCSDVSGMKNIMGRLAGFEAAASQLDDQRIVSAFNNSKWIITCTEWFSAAVRPICGQVVYTGPGMILFINGQGRCVDQFTCGYKAAIRETMTLGHIIGLGLSFLHCKNVRKDESEINRGEKWHRRKNIIPLRFHTLDINPMRQVLRTEGNSQSNGIKKALHICRGHFAKYTEDAPLFGKYVGDYWRPDHVRGSADNGRVVKDYQIKI